MVCYPNLRIIRSAMNELLTYYRWLFFVWLVLVALTTYYVCSSIGPALWNF